jgi:hypothetical protein
MGVGIRIQQNPGCRTLRRLETHRRAKCSLLKNGPVKGFCDRNLSPPHCIQYTYSHREGRRVGPERRGVHKAGSKIPT